jgi:hypothetical protein
MFYPWLRLQPYQVQHFPIVFLGQVEGLAFFSHIYMKDLRSSSFIYDSKYCVVLLEFM